MRSPAFRLIPHFQAMQRRRLNLKLLLGLAGGALVVLVLIFFVHRWQVERNAGALLTLADQAQQSGNLGKAAEHLRAFVNFRPDDVTGYVKWANVTTDLAEKPTSTHNERVLANSVLEAAMRKAPEQSDLRRRLIDFKMKIGRLRDAREHLEVLIQERPDDPELQLLLARCLVADHEDDQAQRLLFGLVGYDRKSGTFDIRQARAAKQVEVYALLAALLRVRQELPELAEQVADQMVAANSNDFRAYLERGRFRMSLGKRDLAKQDLARAFEMAPQDPDAIVDWAAVKIEEKDFDAACQLLDRGIELAPTEERMYRQRASMEFFHRQDLATALKYVQMGLKAVPNDQSLTSFQAELQLRQEDRAGIDATLATMQKAEVDAEVIDYYRARRLTLDRKWIDAVREFERLRPLLAHWPERQNEISLYLGKCYERIGQPDRALEAYRLVLRTDARLEEAKDGVERMMRATGQAKPPGADTLSALTAEQLRLPAASRDWKRVEDKVEEEIRERKLDEAAAALLRVQLLMVRQQYDDAAALLATRLESEPGNLTLWLYSIAVTQMNPQQGAKPALQQLTAAERKFGDHVDLRLMRSKLLAQLREPDLPQRLRKLEDAPPTFSESERRRLWTGLASVYRSLGMADDLRRCWQLLAKSEPQNMSVRLQLFELAREREDNAAMQAALDEILEVAGSKQDSVWQYCEAARLLMLAAKSSDPAPQLIAAQELLDRSLKARPEWSQLHGLRAQLFTLQQRNDEAIDSYARAFELGPPQPNDVRQQVQLLSTQGRFEEAQRTLASLSQDRRRGVRPELQAEIYLRTGEVDEGLKLATEAIARDPNNAIKQVWYGQVLARAEETERAEQAFRRAVELAPQNPQTWLALVGNLVQAKQTEQAETELKRAAQQLDRAHGSLVQARGHEMLGQAAAAESHYQAALHANPADMALLRSAAAFYLGPVYTKPDGVSQGNVLLDRILAADRKKAADSPEIIAWARRTKARVIAGGGTYPDLLKAMSLIEANAIGGHWRPVDLSSAATILAARPEAVSRRKAIRFLKEVQDTQDLSVGEQLLLAELYNQLGDWEKCRAEMLDLLARQSSNPVVLRAYCQLLLARGLVSQAERYVERLTELEPDSLGSLLIRVQLLQKSNKTSEAVELATKGLPAIPSASDTQQLARAALLLRQAGLNDEAAKVMRQYVAFDLTARLALAEFVGKQGDLPQAFDLLDEAAKDQPAVDVARVAILILRERRSAGDTAGSKPKQAPDGDVAPFEARVAPWLAAAERQQPNSIPLLHQKSAWAEYCGKSDEEEAVYRAMLAQPELKRGERVLILNNLAFNLALRNKHVDESRQLIKEAIGIYGPSGFLIDTRAMVSLAAGDYEGAISDLNLAISEQDKPTRFFHLALAQQAAGNKTAAQRAFQEARKRGLTASDLSLLERSHHERLVRELGSS